MRIRVHRSTPPLVCASSDRILEAIVAFVDEVVGDRFTLVGESYGGYLARGVLSRRPSDVTGLMLVCPVVNASHGMRDLPDEVTHFTDDDYLRSLDDEDRSRFTDSFVIADKRTHDRYVTALRGGMEAAGHNAQIERSEPFGTLAKDWLDRLEHYAH